MPDWDEDSPQLRVNLTSVSERLRKDAQARNSPQVAMALHWQSIMMAGLSVPNPSYVGAFRGSKGLERVNVRVGENVGVAASKVENELQLFELKLIVSIRDLDTRIPQNASLTSGLLREVIELCAWAHAEWVRIHPFANGNGRTARLWANYIAMRYGLPPFVALRPRPERGYGEAGAAAMQGNPRPTEKVFRLLLDSFLADSP